MGIVNSIRDALASQIGTTGIFCYDNWADTVNPPACMIKPRDADFNLTFGAGNMTEYHFEAHVLVSFASGLAAAQDQLDEYLAPTGTQSIRAAVQADTTLGGNVSLAVVTGWRDYGGKEVGGVEFLGAVVDLEITV